MAILMPSKPSRPSNGSSRGARRRPEAPESLADSASAWLAHPLADVVLVTVPAAILMGLGVLMVWSASTVFAYTQFQDAFYFMQRHLVFLGVALFAGWVASRVSPDRLRMLAWPAYLLTGVLLLLTFTPLGYGVGGNKNWLNLGGSISMLRLQPAELAKLAIVVWGGAVLATKRRLLTQPKHLLVPFVPLSALLIVLVVLQGDLGTALILSALLMAVLWIVGAPWPVLGGFALAGAAGLGALAVATPSRVARIFGFLDPAADPSGINHQPIQALYGLATGGWLGVGLGESRQKWGSLSQAHTDYVLAVIGEELGVFATLAVLGLFVVLAWGGVRIALRTSTFFGRIVAAGITTWLLLQALVNIMVVLRLLPVLGVPLPFVSYGGSALLANLCALGILVACARDEPDAKAWLRRRAKSRAPRRRLSAVLPGRRRS